MRKLFTFMLLAAALLISAPSSAYVEGTEKDFTQYNFLKIGTSSKTNHFGTICIPEKIVAIQGIVLYDFLCVDLQPEDTSKVARLVVDVHRVCSPNEQDNDDGLVDDMYCPTNESSPRDPKTEKAWVDWESFLKWDGQVYYKEYYHTVAGASYFYTACKGADELTDRKVWVDENNVASAPAGVNGYYGTFTTTTINSPVTLLTQLTQQSGDSVIVTQYLEQVTRATIPANRGYFKGNFEGTPWRYNTSSSYYDPAIHGKAGLIHYDRCKSGGAAVARRQASPNAVAFNVGLDNNSGVYTIDFEHPIYLSKETNKRIENGQLIIETADGTKYNAFGQRVK